jgi:XTP/dITP diphosphohydrolase
MKSTIRNQQSAIRNPIFRNLLIATTNKGKIAEIAELLDDLNIRVIGLSDLPQQPPSVDETGETFAENALIKAEHYHAQTGLVTLADDSGLEVDALGGRPGVYSARYGGEGLSSSEQVALLLDELKAAPAGQRSARFVCCMAIVGPAVRQTFEGRCEGLIAFEPRGDGGFGYDPIFIDAELGRTFAELSRSEKAARSHRGKALRDARKFIERMMEERDEG